MPYAIFETGEVRLLLYDSPNPAPNPRRVRIFLAEKGVRVPTTPVSITRGEHKGDAYRAINPLGQTPSLALDNGVVLTESVAICRYLEGVHPQPPLFGHGPLDQALVEMWTRRVEMRLMFPLSMVWAHTHPFTARVVKPQYTEFGESQRPRVVSAMREFDRALDGKDWLDGEAYSMADIVLLTTLDFAEFVGIAMPEDAPALRDWHARATARPSAQA